METCPVCLEENIHTLRDPGLKLPCGHWQCGLCTEGHCSICHRGLLCEETDCSNCGFSMRIFQSRVCDRCGCECCVECSTPLHCCLPAACVHCECNDCFLNSDEEGGEEDNECFSNSEEGGEEEEEEGEGEGEGEE